MQPPQPISTTPAVLATNNPRGMTFQLERRRLDPGSSVAPIEGVQLGIGVSLKLKHQLVACGDPAIDRVAHLSLLVFEALGQHDACPVFVAGHWVFDGLYIGLGDTRDSDGRTPLLTID